jgi:RimJ/RimL family protein N-acetyltransferase
LPRWFWNKTGRRIQLTHLPAADGQRLIEMYLAFQPRNSFQGLPPIKDQVCIEWVNGMLRDGINIVARDGGKSLVGHSAIFPINDEKCEMLVVVCPDWQNLGIGTELVHGCIELADELGYRRIWLPVDATNVRARHVYRKCGFEYVSDRPGRELDMVCDVSRRLRLDAAATVPPAPCFFIPALSIPPRTTNV